MKSLAPCMSSHLDIDTTGACCMTASAPKSDFHSEEMQACFTKLMQLVPEKRTDDEMNEMELLQDVIDYIKDLKDILGLQCDLQSSSHSHTQESATMTTDECRTSTLSTSSSRRSVQDDWSPLPPSE